MAVNFRKSKVFKNKSYSKNKNTDSKSFLSKFLTNFSLPKLNFFDGKKKRPPNKNLSQSILTNTDPTNIIRSQKNKQKQINSIDKIFGPARNVDEVGQNHSNTKKFQKDKSKLNFNVTNGFKSIPKFDSKRTLYNVNYFFVKNKIISRFNWVVFGITAACLICFITYLLFFDTFFLIKNYNVTFAQSSYLSDEDSKAMVDAIKKDKFLGFVPNNQLWFANSKNMTIAANRNLNEVKNVMIENRVWPNSINIKVVTQPILITLAINSDEYWRVGRNGDVLSRDDAGLRENVVVVERPISFNRPNVSLSQYKFDRNCPKDTDQVINNAEQCDQLNRFWFTIWIWQQLDNLGIKYNKTIYPSLFDTDVFVQTETGSILRFNAGNMSGNIQQQRLQNVLQSDILNRVNEGKIAYLDFRIAKKVYICNKGGQCEKSLVGT